MHPTPIYRDGELLLANQSAAPATFLQPAFTPPVAHWPLRVAYCTARVIASRCGKPVMQFSVGGHQAQAIYNFQGGMANSMNTMIRAFGIAAACCLYVLLSQQYVCAVGGAVAVAVAAAVAAGGYTFSRRCSRRCRCPWIHLY